MVVLFRYQIGNGFVLLTGDEYDGNIEVAILEHWYNAVRGLEAWDRVAWFFPYQRTLGYNDGYALYGLVYSALRAVGCDAYLACEGVNIAVRGLGYVGFALFAYAVGTGFAWALLGAALFTLANGAFLHAVHAQLLSVSFAPLLGWLLVRAAQALHARRRQSAACWGGGAGLLLAAWLLTAFYMAWFFVLFLVLTVSVLGLLSVAGHGVSWSDFRRVLAWPLAVAAAVFAVGCIPFLSVYLAKANETGMHPYEALAPYLPSWLDLLHLGSGNLLYGGLDRVLTAARPGITDMGEHTVGMPPVLLLLCLLGVVRPWRLQADDSGGGRYRLVLWRSIAAAVVAALALTMDVGGVTAWSLVYRYVPGAAAIRVVSRQLLFLAFPVTVVAVLYASSRFARWPALACAGIAALLVLEQLNTQPQLGLDRPASLRMLASVPPVPRGCRAFFASTRPVGPTIGGEELDRLYRHNVQAMLIAERVLLPTVNGFSTFNPPDWDFAAPGRADYLERVRSYATAHGILDGLCGLDLARMQWDAAPFRSP